MEEILDTEIGKKFLALTKASFRVSSMIPDLVLRDKIKHQTLDIYKKFFTKNSRELLSEIDALDKMFYLAGHLSLAKEEHVKSLRNSFLVFKSYIVLANYDVLKGQNEKSFVTSASAETSAGKKAMEDKKNQDDALNERQEKIIRYFKDKKTAKFSELLKMFSHISEKTIRNDLGYLINIGRLSRLEKGIYERK